MTRTFQDCTVSDCPRQTPDTGYVCTECAATLTRNLRVLLDLPEGRPTVTYAHPMYGRITRPTGLPDTRTGLEHDLVDRMTRAQTITADANEGRDGAPQDRGPVRLPYAYRTAEARRDLINTMCAAADGIARRRGLHRPLDTPQALAYWLTHHVQWLRQQEDGGAIIGELLYAVREAIKAVDNPPERRYAGPCTASTTDEAGLERPCDGELYALQGREQIECPACGATYPVSDRRAWLLEHADDMLLPATELARAIDGLGVPVTGAMIRRWKMRGMLANKGTDERPLYRVGDVRALVLVRAHEAQQRGGKVGA